MTDDKRQHKRFEKPLTISYCLANASHKHWDMSIIKNISAGGVRFNVTSNWDIANKAILIQIRIPEFSPGVLKLEGIVLSVTPRQNTRYSDVRVKFINLTEAIKKDLFLIQEIIDLKMSKIDKKHHEK